MSSMNLILEDPQKGPLNFTRYTLENTNWEIKSIIVRYRRYSPKKTFAIYYTKIENKEYIKPYLVSSEYEFKYLFNIKNNNYSIVKNYAICLTNITTGCG
tara:strand:- start:552 stop:851 length:300 start_codon:yes stop_codon:yes gene_type:complete